MSERAGFLLWVIGLATGFALAKGPSEWAAAWRRAKAAFARREEVKLPPLAEPITLRDAYAFVLGTSAAARLVSGAHPESLRIWDECLARVRAEAENLPVAAARPEEPGE